MESLKHRWKSVPHPIRKPVVLVVGLLFVLAAAATGWLPGPGGIPLFLIGIAILASEFVWAERIKDKIMAVLHVIFAWFRRNRLFGSILIALGVGISATTIYLLYLR